MKNQCDGHVYNLLKNIVLAMLCHKSAKNALEPGAGITGQMNAGNQRRSDDEMPNKNRFVFRLKILPASMMFIVFGGALPDMYRI